MKNLLGVRLAWLAVFTVIPTAAFGWGYGGHRMVNELALKSLPTDFPKFVRAPVAADRIAFLAGEPDRWRNTKDETLDHYNKPDHFFDLEYLTGFGLTPDTVSPFRYDFVTQLAAGRAKNPNVEPVADPKRDADHTRSYFGFLPWAINEYYSKLRSQFSYLKTFEEHGGTPEEIRNAQENIIYIMGVMGHYVGDATQPLHTTKHFNGWVGENPKNYTTWARFHSLIDSDYLDKVGLEVRELYPKIRPAKSIEGANAGNLGVFPIVMKFLVDQNKLVEPLYILNQRHKLSPEEDVAREGKAFLSEQLVKGGHWLGSLWLTAWQTAPKDTFLQSQLAKRKLRDSGEDPSAKKKKKK